MQWQDSRAHGSEMYVIVEVLFCPIQACRRIIAQLLLNNMALGADRAVSSVHIYSANLCVLHLLTNRCKHITHVTVAWLRRTVRCWDRHTLLLHMMHHARHHAWLVQASESQVVQIHYRAVCYTLPLKLSAHQCEGPAPRLPKTNGFAVLPSAWE